MTHYLRSKHDAILIGVGTAVADNPSLNCRIDGVGGYGGEGLTGQPRPVVVDPKGRWEFSAESKVMKLASEGNGRAPWIITKAGSVDGTRRAMLESVGGKVIEFDTLESSLPWTSILKKLSDEGIRSVMIEGGGGVINDLLAPGNEGIVDSVIVTIAPIWLGKGGVQVCPDARVEDGQRLAMTRLTEVKWVPLGEDVVVCGYPRLA